MKRMSSRATRRCDRARPATATAPASCWQASNTAWTAAAGMTGLPRSPSSQPTGALGHAAANSAAAPAHSGESSAMVCSRRVTVRSMPSQFVAAMSSAASWRPMGAMRRRIYHRAGGRALESKGAGWGSPRRPRASRAPRRARWRRAPRASSAASARRALPGLYRQRVTRPQFPMEKCTDPRVNPAHGLPARTLHESSAHAARCARERPSSCSPPGGPQAGGAAGWWGAPPAEKSGPATRSSMRSGSGSSSSSSR